MFPRTAANLVLPLLAALALVPACDKSRSKSKPKQTPHEPAKTVHKPRGWKAYDGKRKTDVSKLPPAANATIYASDGKPFELASAWKDGRALIVFYRGHW